LFVISGGIFENLGGIHPEQKNGGLGSHFFVPGEVSKWVSGTHFSLPGRSFFEKMSVVTQRATVMDQHGRSSKFLVNRKMLICTESPLWLAPQMAAGHPLKKKNIFFYSHPSLLTLETSTYTTSLATVSSEYADRFFFFSSELSVLSTISSPK
jgi:hypothetical protein